MQVKAVVADAQTKLHAEIGPELRKPLAELRRLRSPRAAVAEVPAASASTPPARESSRAGAGLVAGQRPPIDPDAT